MGQHRRNYTDDYKAAAVERLYEPGATQGSVAKGLGITGTQVKTWRLEIEVFGSVEAKRRQKTDAAERVRLRKDNKRLGPVEIHRVRMIVAPMWIIASKLVSVLHARIAIRLNSVSF